MRPILVYAAIAIAACAHVAPPPTAAEEEDLAKFRKETLQCIENNDTRAAIDACRDGVRLKHHRPIPARGTP